jgi:AraC-like DNA-binding protein
MNNISKPSPLCPVCRLSLRLPVTTAPAEVAPRSGTYEALKELEARRKSYAERVAIRRIAISLVYMLEHVDRPLRVAELSRISDISKSHFFALFKRATGETPINFLIRARMHRASIMLCGTSMAVKEVAASLGYSDEFYFSRMFKLFYGLSPSHYRIQKLKMEPVCVPSP